jgi:DNA-binding NarL/FixJ family response regulator
MIVNNACLIIIADTSYIVYEGLTRLLTKKGLKYEYKMSASIEETGQYLLKGNVCSVIINPALFGTSIKAIQILKELHPSVKWVGFIHSYHDSQLLTLFDEIITISDSVETIASKLIRVNEVKHKDNLSQEKLSERETDVLKNLVTGMSNKEIADKLNISINTVITHRKNITQKTGIKSVSGLTIFAVVRNIITID